MHYLHGDLLGRRSFSDKAEFLQIMNGLREAGVDAMFDIYNELLGVSVITVILRRAGTRPCPSRSAASP